MNRWNQRQSITFRSVCAAILTGSAVLGTWGTSAAPAWADGPVDDAGGSSVGEVRSSDAEVNDLLREIMRKLGGNPNTLNPQPKAAMAEIAEFWEENGLLPFVNRLSLLVTATELQTLLLTRPGDLEPETVSAFLVTLGEIIDATKVF